jgi:hypothetical protein
VVVVVGWNVVVGAVDWKVFKGAVPYVKVDVVVGLMEVVLLK